MKNAEKHLDFDLQLFAKEGDGEDGKGKEGEHDDLKLKPGEYEDLEKIKKVIAGEEVTSDLLKKLVLDLIDDNSKHRGLSHERLIEVMEKKAKLKEREEKEDAERTEKLKAQEKYKELNEEIEPKLKILTKDLEKTQDYFEGELLRKTAKLPEKYKKYIPASLDIRDKLKWLDTFLEDFVEEESKAKAAEGDKGGGAAGGTEQNINIGGSQTIPAKQGGEATPAKAKVEEMLLSAKSPKELKEVLKKLGRTAGD